MLAQLAGTEKSSAGSIQAASIWRGRREKIIAKEQYGQVGQARCTQCVHTYRKTTCNLLGFKVSDYAPPPPLVSPAGGLEGPP